jgi:HSP20 family molecular chaperone IbpA
MGGAVKSNYDPRFDPAAGYQPYGFWNPGFGMYAGVPMIVRLVSDIAQARLRAAATVATSVADTVTGMSSIMAQQWNATAARVTYAATGPMGWAPPVGNVRDAYRPASTTSMVEGDENYHASVELPSTDADEVSVVIARDHVEVHGRSRPDCGPDILASISIPADVDRDNISAEIRDGILYLKLPKEAKGVRRELKVKVTGGAKTPPSSPGSR